MIFEMNLMKFYLARILGTYKDSEMESGPLLLYSPMAHTMVGEVLMQSKCDGEPGPFIPMFYQHYTSGNNAKVLFM